MKTVHTLLFIGILVFVGACNCVCTYDNPFGFAWVECEDGQAVEYFSYPFPATAVPLSSSDWYCPPDPNSPPRPNSQAAFDSVAFGDDARMPTGHSHAGTKLPPRATSVSYPYLAHPILALPFTVLLNSPIQQPCDPTSPDVFQVNYQYSQVNRISTCPIQVKAGIPVASAPLQIAITPDGTTAVVTSFNNAVNFIDLKSNKVAYTLLTDQDINPSGVAISP